MATLRNLFVTLLLSTAAVGGCAADATSSATFDQTERGAAFQVFEGADAQLYFQLVAGNGECMLRSEGYRSASSVRGGMDVVRAVGTDEERYDVRKAADGDYYFNLVARNGEIIGTSETYVTEHNAQRAVRRLIEVVGDAQVGSVDSGGGFGVFEGRDGDHYFHLRADNGQIVLQSQGYATRDGASNGMRSVKANGVDAGAYEFAQSSDARYYFTIKAANHRTIGRSQMYTTQAGAERGASAVRQLLRRVAGVMPTDAEIRAEIEPYAQAATYVSEADHPFEYVEAPSGGATNVSEELVRSAFAAYVDGDPEADGPMNSLNAQEQSVRRWTEGREPCADQACAARYHMIDSVLENLSDVRVYYFGAGGEPGRVEGVGVSVFLVGLTPSGTLAGVRSLAIWT